MLNKILDESGRLPRACANVAGIPTGKNCLKSLSFLDNLFFHCCVGMRVRERLSKICQCIAAYNPGLTVVVFFFAEAKTRCSGIINLLFSVLVDITHGHFTHCSVFSSPLQGLGKIPHY